ncbi:MAG: IS630 family transposase, partial [bacterium]|nr:IS630 family transposase [bacterium]
FAAIGKWTKKYKQEGIKGLSKKKQGRPRSSGKLKGWQASWISRAITDQCPDQLKLPFMLWTREAVQQLIKDKFDIEYSLPTISRLLKKWGFTLQKPLRFAYERNDQKIAQWVKVEYPSIKRQAQKENAEIHWGDEMGIRFDDQAGRSFSKKGKTPVIKKTGKRFKCNMISTVTNSGKNRFMIYQDSFTVEVFLKFLRRLIYKADRQIYLIVDNHKVHHAYKVQDWLEKHKDKISIFYLPPYAPELKPDELLNQDVKSNAVKHRKPENTNHLKKALKSYMCKIQKSPTKVADFFKKKEVAYTA